MDCLSTNSFPILPKTFMTTTQCGRILHEIQASPYLEKDHPKHGWRQRTNSRTFILEAHWRSTPSQTVPYSTFHSIQWILICRVASTEHLAETDFCIS